MIDFGHGSAGTPSDLRLISSNSFPTCLPSSFTPTIISTSPLSRRTTLFAMAFGTALAIPLLGNHGHHSPFDRDLDTNTEPFPEVPSIEVMSVPASPTNQTAPGSRRQHRDTGFPEPFDNGMSRLAHGFKCTPPYIVQSSDDVRQFATQHFPILGLTSPRMLA